MRLHHAVLYCFMVAAASRLYVFIARDGFPPMKHLRLWVHRSVKSRHGGPWADGLTCPWCCGTWLGLAVVGAVWHWCPLPLPALWFLAVPYGVGKIAGRT